MFLYNFFFQTVKEGSEKYYQFVKPLSEECSKTCMKAERILRKIEKPFNLNNEMELKQSHDIKLTSSKDIYHEERLLSELFYTSKGLEDHVEPVLFLNGDKNFLESPKV